ncbi:ATP-binding protein [Streptomyces sp. AA1529]|uniref:ATP-binding protein n=1 Tax=Streptomyces sp. AA1529 TaxID=1203257 RepID=UPI00030EB581|nr:ATP-binding protein [Streptomyces sp. AA1529]MBE9499631.1 ATP-binding protein [Streptomyces sp. GKU 257-1]
MLSLHSDEASVADARALAASYVAEHCPGIDATTVGTVVTELVVNAERHTSGSWLLVIDRAGGVLSAEVRDASRELPGVRAGALDGSGGWGMHLVHALTPSVQVTVDGPGKTVSARWPDLPAQAA